MSLFCARQGTHLLKSFLIPIFISNCCVSLASAEGIFSSITQFTNTKAIEKCVAKINRNADESLDTAARLYQTGMCYFCVGCDLDADNGHIFEGNHPTDFTLHDSYVTAYKLLQQAADLGNQQANYGLAALIYANDLTKNKITKDKIASQEIEKITQKANAKSSLAEEELNNTIETLKKEVYAKPQNQDFSTEIHVRLLKAAKQGHIPSQFALSQVYSRGVGVKPNKIKAYAWAATAVAQDPPFGSDRRDIHAMYMNTSELFEAESLADRYMKKYTNIFERPSVTVMR